MVAQNTHTGSGKRVLPDETIYTIIDLANWVQIVATILQGVKVNIYIVSLGDGNFLYINSRV